MLSLSPRSAICTLCGRMTPKDLGQFPVFAVPVNDDPGYGSGMTLCPDCIKLVYAKMNEQPRDRRQRAYIAPAEEKTDV